MSEFKYKHILDAIVKEAETSDTPWDIVQLKRRHQHEWETLRLMPRFSDDFDYRLKPKTITIAGIEVSEPLRIEEMKHGDEFYTGLVNSNFSFRQLVLKHQFIKIYDHSEVFRLRLARRTFEEAEQLANALHKLIMDALLK